MSQEKEARVDFSAFHSRLRLPGVLRLETALRIGAGTTGGAAGVDLPVVKDVAGRPYIPGSSFKGAYRAHLEAILRAFDFDPELACISVPRPEKKGESPGCLTQGDVNELKIEYRDDAESLSRAIIGKSCWTCRLCGAPWLASKVLFKDLTVRDKTFGRYVERDGVAIDRDTGTAGEGLLYNFEAVPPGTEFSFEMVVENATRLEQGLALLGVQEFEKGRVALGGGSSRGLGRVKLSVDWEKSEVVDRDSLREYLLTGQGQRLDDEKRKDLLDTFLAEIWKVGRVEG